MRRALIALALLATPLVAQDTKARTPGTCFRPRDASVCSDYIITELTISQAMWSTSETLHWGNASEAQPDFETKGHATIGWARNLSNRRSLGAAAVFDVSHDFDLTNLEVRYRKWFGPNNTAVELRGGYAQAELENGRSCPGSFISCNYRSTAHGVTGGAALVLGPYVTVFTRADLLTTEGKLRGGWSTGIGGTSHASYASGAAVLGLMMIALASLGPDY